jgi:hypothetical protein
MRESERPSLPGSQGRGELAKQRRLVLVGHEEHEHIGPAGHLEGGAGRDAIRCGTGQGGAPGAQSDLDRDPLVAQVERLGPTLIPVAEDPDPAAGERGRIDVALPEERVDVASWRG